jgi:hypothetical protein
MNMRNTQNFRLQSGKIDVAKIQFDPKSRDDIPQILKGLQYIYTNCSIRDHVFGLLEEHISPEISKTTGRPGMDLWTILVLGVLRLDLNCDYDRLQELANNHRAIRQMLGHNFTNEICYHIQTLKDNVNLLTPELLDKINNIIVETGHALVKKKENEVLRGRCDSFVVKTNVHYPTDINLLLDAMRKVILLTARLSDKCKLSSWRQSAYNVRHLRRLMRFAQQKKRARGKTEAQKEKNNKLIKQAHQEYLHISQQYLNKIHSIVPPIVWTKNLPNIDTESRNSFCYVDF